MTDLRAQATAVAQRFIVDHPSIYCTCSEAAVPPDCEPCIAWAAELATALLDFAARGLEEGAVLIDQDPGWTLERQRARLRARAAEVRGDG